MKGVPRRVLALPCALWVVAVLLAPRGAGAGPTAYMTDMGTVLATTGAGFKLWKWYAHTFLMLGAWLVLPLTTLLALARVGEERLPALLLLATVVVLAWGPADMAHVLALAGAPLLVATVEAWRWRERLPTLPVLGALPLAALLAFGALGLVVYVDDARRGTSASASPSSSVASERPQASVQRGGR